MDCTTENGVAALVRQRHHRVTAGAPQTAPWAGIGVYRGVVRILTGSLDLAMQQDHIIQAGGISGHHA